MLSVGNRQSKNEARENGDFHHSVFAEGRISRLLIEARKITHAVWNVHNYEVGSLLERVVAEIGHDLDKAEAEDEAAADFCELDDDLESPMATCTKPLSWIILDIHHHVHI